MLNPILTFKVTKFLVEISWFKFLVMTEKNTFVVYKQQNTHTHTHTHTQHTHTAK